MIITDNYSRELIIKYEDGLFTLITRRNNNDLGATDSVIFLTELEAQDIANYINLNLQEQGLTP
jgi:hypothetical protein